jgi:hypothetical protein
MTTWPQYLQQIVARGPPPHHDDGDASVPRSEIEWQRLAHARQEKIAAYNARRRRQRRSTRFCAEDQGEPERLLSEAEIRRAIHFYCSKPWGKRDVPITHLAAAADLSAWHIYRIRRGHHLTERTRASLSKAIIFFETPLNTHPAATPQRWPIGPHEKTEADRKVIAHDIGGLVVNFACG